MDISKTASRIMDSARLGTRAVFYINGEVRTLSFDSDKGQKMFKDFSSVCIGIYNDKCNREFIVDDLKSFMGIV